MKIKLKKLLIIFSFFGIICLTAFGVTIARYIYNSNKEYYLKSKGFYFESDYLDTEIINNVNNAWDGSNINFTIRNNSNKELITEYDINYKIDCEIVGEASSHTACYINNIKSNTYESILQKNEFCNNTKGDNVDVSSYEKDNCISSGYDWKKEIVEDNIHFNVVSTDNNNIKDVTVKITATSTLPYQKKIQGLFILHKTDNTNGGVTMNYINYSNYSRLNITNRENTSKCIKLSWNADNLVIDNNYDLLSVETNANGYINAFNVNISPKLTISYIYYNKTNMIYDVSSFSIIEGNNC